MQIDATHIPCEEQETVINWTRGSDVVTLSISDNTVLTRIKRLMKKCPELIDCRVYSRDRDGRPTEYEVQMPLKCLRFTAPRIKRELTAEQRAARAERMRARVRRKSTDAAT